MRQGLAFFLLVAGFSTVAGAQQGTSNIQGRALDGQGGALPGVVVVVTHEGTALSRETQTGPDGAYSVTNLVAGPYRVSAELTGFRKLNLEHIVLTAGLTVTQDLGLQIGALEETLTVTGQSPQVDTTSSAVATNINFQQVQALPSISHNLMGALSLVPGAVYVPGYKPSVEAISVNGNVAGQHYYLDGGSNFSMVFTGSVGTRVMVPTDVIQEVVVFANQVPAEYGGRNGAVANVVTRQGTNSFQGTLQGYFNNQSLTAKDAVAVANNGVEPDIKRYSSGFTLGGPIVRSKLFFFGAYEYTFLGRSNTVAYPTSPQWSYSSQALTKGSNTFARVDHQLGNNNTYSARFIMRNSGCQGDPGCRAGGAGTALPTGGSTVESLTDEWEIDTNLIANFNRVIGPTKLNTITFSFPRQSISTGPPADQPNAQTVCMACADPTLRYLSYEIQSPYFAHTRWEPQYRLEEAFSWFVGGKHNLKFGGLYNYGNHLRIDHEAENGIFAFPSNNAFNPNNPSTYPERLLIRNGQQQSNPIMHVWAAYAQDKWQPTDNLTLNLGLRYDLVYAPTPNEFNPLFDDRSKYPIDTKNFGPHLGFAYGTSSRKAVIRGGYVRLFNAPVFSGQMDNYWRQGLYGTGYIMNFPTNTVDPGPAAGRLPTNPFLLTYGPNGPVVNRALLNQLFPLGSLQQNLTTVYIDHPDRNLPVADQYTIGYQRELGPLMSASVDYIHIAGTKDLTQYDLNPGIKPNTSRTAPITRVDILGIAEDLGVAPFTGSVFTSLSTGDDSYDGLNLSFDKRMSNGWASRVSYVRARCLDTSGSDQFQVLEVQHITEAPCAADRSNIFNLSGALEVPNTGGMLVTGSYRVMSGTPLNVFNSNVDTDRNGILVDPLPAGTYSGVGPSPMTVSSDGNFRGARGPGFQELDLRVGYRFALPKSRTLEIAADTFNVTNHANYSNPTSDLRQPTFLLLNTILPGGFPRSVQVSGKVRF